MEYFKVAQISDLKDGMKIKINLKDKDILLTKIENEYFAIDNICPHMGGSLVEGQLVGNQIICPRHGSIYDVRNGKVIERGSLFFIKVKTHDLQSYPVKIEGTDILIGME